MKELISGQESKRVDLVPLFFHRILLPRGKASPVYDRTGLPGSEGLNNFQEDVHRDRCKA